MIIDGRWKLVAKGVTGPWELYDIEADRTESRDLAEEQPGRADEKALVATLVFMSSGD